MKTLKRLAKLADDLDNMGMYPEADVITDVVTRVAQQTPPELLNMDARSSTHGNYDLTAWRQAFMDKYKKFQEMMNIAKDDQTPMDAINPAGIQSLYNEMMYLAGNYLSNDPAIFNIMKNVVMEYKGIFENGAV